MVPVISVRVADVPAAAAGAAAGAEEGEVEADVTLPSGRPQERLQLCLLWIYLLRPSTTMVAIWLQEQQLYFLPWLQEWLRLLLARLVAVASGEYTPLALRHGDPPLLY